MSRIPPVPPGLAVLYADAELIAVDKPAGLHTAPQGRPREDTVLGRLLAQFPELAQVPGRRTGEPGLLHRLDRGTSGVLLAARTTAAFQSLSAGFAAGRVRKEYLALCAPALNLRAAGGLGAGQVLALESRFAPYGPGRRKVRVVPLAGREACTDGRRQAGALRARRKASAAIYRSEAEVLELRGGLALVRVVLVRGFRHQARAHLGHLGLPIVGDELYGAPVPPGLSPRLYLHAWRVELSHPAGGKRMRIEAPCPLEFGDWVGLARQPTG